MRLFIKEYYGLFIGLFIIAIAVVALALTGKTNEAICVGIFLSFVWFLGFFGYKCG